VLQQQPSQPSVYGGGSSGAGASLASSQRFIRNGNAVQSGQVTYRNYMPSTNGLGSTSSGVQPQPPPGEPKGSAAMARRFGLTAAAGPASDVSVPAASSHVVPSLPSLPPIGSGGTNSGNIITSRRQPPRSYNSGAGGAGTGSGVGAAPGLGSSSAADPLSLWMKHRDNSNTGSYTAR
jgi:hypothetical protein